jgi:hypothetical protein
MKRADHESIWDSGEYSVTAAKAKRGEDVWDSGEYSVTAAKGK